MQQRKRGISMWGRVIINRIKFIGAMVCEVERDEKIANICYIYIKRALL